MWSYIVYVKRDVDGTETDAGYKLYKPSLIFI
jgi:hypothetical protein